MKKFFMSLFSFVLILAGGIFSSNIFSSSASSVVNIEINDATEFVDKLSNLSTYYNESIVITLVNDIDLAGVDITDISWKGEEGGKPYAREFYGVFDGNGHTISNINYTSHTQYFGILSKTDGATIKNVKISGELSYAFDPLNVSEIYAGGLVGYAKNTIFENCEFYYSQDNQINLQVYADLNFGMLAGKVDGNPIASSTGCRANIKNCLNFYNLNVNLVNSSNVYIGSFVGNSQNGYLLNTYSKANINFDGEGANKYLGGIVGSVSGSGTHIRNSVYVGNISLKEGTNQTNLYQGAILGGALDSAVGKENINFAYYTDSTLLPSGDNYIVASDKVTNVAKVDKAFMTNVENFDQQSNNIPFDFEKIWILRDSNLHLQHFLTFDVDFSNALSNVINITRFYIEAEKKFYNSYSYKYGETIAINFQFKEEYFGYYQLSGITLSNLAYDMQNATIEEVLSINDQKLAGYWIYAEANATTAGTYDFVMEAITFNCVATISDEAKEQGQGGLRLGGNGNASLTNQISIPFIYNHSVASNKTLVAEATSGSIYTFDHWELFYKENGEFSSQAVEFDYSEMSNLVIAFGTKPFDREFKLVAYFTDENAILVDFGAIDRSLIKSVKFNNVEYVGDAIAVSPNQTKYLEVLTAKDYKLDLTSFTNSIKALYGSNSIDSLIVSDPQVNENGETLYKFALNMRSMEALSKKELSLKLEALKDNSNSSANMIWVWIGVGAVALIIVVVAVILIIKKTSFGKSKNKKSKTSKTKEKTINYKDYV